MNASKLINEAQWIARECHILFPESDSFSVRQVISILNLDESDDKKILSPDIQMKKITDLIKSMKLGEGQWLNTFDETLLPAIARLPSGLWILISGVDVSSEFLCMFNSGFKTMKEFPEGTMFTSLSTENKKNNFKKKEGAYTLFVSVLSQHKRMFIWVAIAAITANILALSGSLYSMQVYDRVLSTHNLSTLIVLMIGTLLAALTEFIVKLFKLSVTEYVAKTMDITLSARIFRELINIRLDQFPSSVGTLATQFRGYETVRIFMTTAVIYYFVDIPFSVMFLIIIASIAGPIVAIVPVFFILVTLTIGFIYRNKIAFHAASGHDYSAQRHGYMVETIQNIETIKATGSGWTRISGWQILERANSMNSMKLRTLNEQASHFIAFIQQASYISLVSVGAYVAIEGQTLTSGALIACSILSGRLMTPIAGLPGMIMQWANAKASFGGIDTLFTLQKDNDSIKKPLLPEILKGEFRLSDVRFSWPEGPEILRINELSIRSGEKVAIIGGVGSGKSTLLKIMAGLYRPTEGQVLLDNMDIQQIGRTCISEFIGYCPQETRLIAGSLKDNLTAGLSGISDESIYEACRLTGLDKIIAGHPRGLEREISEGGSGLSGGQKQLVALTRLFVSKPSIWLLDEPTSAMDDESERLCLLSMKTLVKNSQSLILVTHKPALLSLVQRIIVLGPTGILLDGTKDEILRRLTAVKNKDNVSDSQKSESVVATINIVPNMKGANQ